MLKFFLSQSYGRYRRDRLSAIKPRQQALLFNYSSANGVSVKKTLSIAPTTALMFAFCVANLADLPERQGCRFGKPQGGGAADRRAKVAEERVLQTRLNCLGHEAREGEQEFQANV